MSRQHTDRIIHLAAPLLVSVLAPAATPSIPCELAVLQLEPNAIKARPVQRRRSPVMKGTEPGHLVD